MTDGLEAVANGDLAVLEFVRSGYKRIQMKEVNASVVQVCSSDLRKPSGPRPPFKGRKVLESVSENCMKS